MKKYITLILTLLLILTFSGCAKDDGINEHIEPFVAAMVNSPNLDYYDPAGIVVTVLGLDETIIPEPTVEQLAIQEKNEKNWAAIGDAHFAPKCFSMCNSLFPRDVFHMYATYDPSYDQMVFFDYGIDSIELKDISLKEDRSDIGRQTVTITILINDEREASFDLWFSFDDNGLIDNMQPFTSYDDIGALLGAEDPFANK